MAFAINCTSHVFYLDIGRTSATLKSHQSQSTMEGKMANERIQKLTDNIPNLSQKDKDFALSLTSQFLNKGKLSDKQWYWVDTLAERNVAPQPKMKLHTMTSVVALFAKPKKLKNPSIEMITPDGTCFTVYRAGPHAKYPGQLQVILENDDWLGRVSEDGEFSVSRKYENTVTLANVVQVMNFFAEHTEEAASAFGRLLGRCCFCSSGLTDERSLQVGYGPTCAANFGLPWGSKIKCEAA